MGAFLTINFWAPENRHPHEGVYLSGKGLIAAPFQRCRWFSCFVLFVPFRGYIRGRERRPAQRSRYEALPD